MLTFPELVDSLQPAFLEAGCFEQSVRYGSFNVP